MLCLGYKSWVIKQYFLNYGLASADVTVGLRPNAPVKVHAHPAGDDWQITMAETGLNTMTGGRVRQVARYLDGDRFMLTYGDGLADITHDTICQRILRRRLHEVAIRIGGRLKKQRH